MEFFNIVTHVGHITRVAYFIRYMIRENIPEIKNPRDSVDPPISWRSWRRYREVSNESLGTWSELTHWQGTWRETKIRTTRSSRYTPGRRNVPLGRTSIWLRVLHPSKYLEDQPWIMFYNHARKGSEITTVKDIITKDSISQTYRQILLRYRTEINR